MTVARGRGESASHRPGLNEHKNNSLSPMDGQRESGFPFDHPAITILQFSMTQTNQPRQPTPVHRYNCISTPPSQRGCAIRSVTS
jgi:hypothetical protein